MAVRARPRRSFTASKPFQRDCRRLRIVMPDQNFATALPNSLHPVSIMTGRGPQPSKGPWQGLKMNFGEFVAYIKAKAYVPNDARYFLQGPFVEPYHSTS